jgi:hypothetical protein
MVIMFDNIRYLRFLKYLNDTSLCYQCCLMLALELFVIYDNMHLCHCPALLRSPPSLSHLQQLTFKAEPPLGPLRGCRTSLSLTLSGMVKKSQNRRRTAEHFKNF